MDSCLSAWQVVDGCCGMAAHAALAQTSAHANTTHVMQVADSNMLVVVNDRDAADLAALEEAAATPGSPILADDSCQLRRCQCQCQRQCRRRRRDVCRCCGRGWRRDHQGNGCRWRRQRAESRRHPGVLAAGYCRQLPGGCAPAARHPPCGMFRHTCLAGCPRVQRIVCTRAHARGLACMPLCPHAKPIREAELMSHCPCPPVG